MEFNVQYRYHGPAAAGGRVDPAAADAQAWVWHVVHMCCIPRLAWLLSSVFHRTQCLFSSSAQRRTAQCCWPHIMASARAAAPAASCRYKEKQLQRFSQQGNQRGVLIVAGGRDMFANAAVSIMMLRRHLRSSLPVEIVHYGESELSKEVLPILQELNSSSSSEAAAKGWASGPVFVTDALQAAPLSQLAAHHKPLKEIRSFPAKVYALTYATRFQQVRTQEQCLMTCAGSNRTIARLRQHRLQLRSICCHRTAACAAGCSELRQAGACGWLAAELCSCSSTDCSCAAAAVKALLGAALWLRQVASIAQWSASTAVENPLV